MSAKSSNVVNLARARALRETFEALHSPESQAVIYSGAAAEFKKLVSPVIRELLSLKGAKPEFQNELITLLEKVYAAHHTDNSELSDLIQRVVAE